METKYFVDFCTHNSESGGWNYKQTKMFDNLSTAQKEYHNLLATYIEYGNLDFVCVVLWDMFGNMIMSENWDIRVAPEPNAE